MEERVRFRPFTGDTEKKIKLKDAPLALVLCQIRWPEFTHLSGDITEVARAFGLALDDYPVASRMQEVAYAVTSEGVMPHAGEKIFQWRSIDDAWHVTLGPRFMTLYCSTAYTSFEDFLARLKPVLEALSTFVKVPLVERIGVRYVNRITDPQLVENLSGYVRPEVLGYSGLLGRAGEVQLVASANQARYVVGDVALQVRSGLVPAGETVDSAIQPVGGTSWILDLDASSEGTAPFDVSEVTATAGRLADLSYDFFKYVSTEGFLREFGDAR